MSSQNNSNFQMDWYDEYINKLAKSARIAVKDAQKAAWRDYFATLKNKAEDMFNKSIQDFYDDYSPLYYDRHESLYKILNIAIDTDGLGMTIGYAPEKMTTFRNGYDGEDGLYEQVFVKGWHGGAEADEGSPSENTPYWRTPHPYYTWWGRRAKVTAISPLDDINRRLDDYEENQMQADYNAIWNEHKGKFKINSNNEVIYDG